MQSSTRYVGVARSHSHSLGSFGDKESENSRTSVFTYPPEPKRRRKIYQGHKLNTVHRRLRWLLYFSECNTLFTHTNTWHYRDGPCVLPSVECRFTVVKDKWLTSKGRSPLSPGRRVCFQHSKFPQHLYSNMMFEYEARRFKNSLCDLWPGGGGGGG